MRIRRTDLAALAVVSVWGVNFAFLKVALGSFHPLAFNGLRFIGMLLLAWTFAGPGALRIPRGDLGRIVIAGLVGYTGYITLSIVGLSFTTAFSQAVIIAAAPLFSVVLLVAWRVESVSRAQVAGMVLAAAGVLIFLSSKLGLRQAGIGDLVSLAAAFFYALYTVLLKPLLARHGARVVTAWTLTAGGIPAILVCVPGLAAQDWRAVAPAAWVVLAWSIAVPVYVAWTVWSWVTARSGVARTNAFMYLVPVVGGVASLVLTGESFGPAKVAGAATVLGGLALMRRRRRAGLDEELRTAA